MSASEILALKTKQAEEEARKEDIKQLKSAGFELVKGIGPVFPGVDPTAIEAALARKKSQPAGEVKEKEPEPALKINPILSEGKVIIEFNQDMLIPNSITPSALRYVFVFSLVSNDDGSVTYGKIVSESELPRTNQTRRQLLTEVTEEEE